MKFLVLSIFLLTVAFVSGQHFYPRHKVVKKYHLMTLSPVNWYRALHHCRSLDMNLVSISSREENSQIIKQIKSEGHERKHFWTSGTNLGFDDGFHWIGNGKSVVFSAWDAAAGQPNNTPNENCLQIFPTGEGSLEDPKWHDRICAHDLFFICEEDQIEYEYCSS